MSEFSVVIPARFASTRLPGKPLIDIEGVPMIARVAGQASQSAATDVVVAADDRRVLDAIKAPGVRAVMTREDHVSGSDRVMEVVELNGWPDDHIVVNVQGDEPLIPPVVINQVAGLLASSPNAGVATLSEPLLGIDEVFDANIVKVVSSKHGRALYFSRAPIPYARDRFGEAPTGPLGGGWRRHIGIYAFRVHALRRFVELPPSRLETTESLEQLRFIENDIDIVVEEAVAAVPGGVDTPADVERIRNVLANVLVANALGTDAPGTDVPRAR